MAELYQQEKLQPSLLDRLTDDTLVEVVTSGDRGGPGGVATSTVKATAASADDAAANVDSSQSDSLKKDSPKTAVDRFSISSRKLRELVMRDIAWLLNTSSLETTMDLSEFPLSSTSVINYGAPSLTGVTLGSLDTRQLERRVKAVILNFEPRILKNSLSVSVVKHDSMSSRALSFEIECDIWGQPAPEHLLINSEIDLETGTFDFAGSPHRMGNS